MGDHDRPSTLRPTRRTVARSAVWSVPAIAAVAPAPALAASRCSVTYTGTVSFAPAGNYTRANYTTGSALVVPSPATDSLLVNFSSVTNGYARDNDANFVKSGTVADKLQLVQTRQAGTGNTPSNAQTVTIAFARPVTNVSFVIDGITRPSNNAYIDTVYTSPLPSFVNGADVIGDGTSANPFRPRVVTASVFTGPAVSTTVTYAGPLTSLTLSYFSSAPTSVGESEQAVYLGPITFNLKPVGCP